MSRLESTPVVGRLAPSPTGVLHVGNARTLVASWLSARSSGGKIYLRIEDLLPGQPERVATVLQDLNYLGLDWDSPPPDRSLRTPADFEVFGVDDGENPANIGFWLQSARGQAYDEHAFSMVAGNAAYPCVCTRKDIEQALRAPHIEDRTGAYPGTCRGRFLDLGDAVRWEGAQSARLGRRPVGAALRMRAPNPPQRFTDSFLGERVVDVATDSGDFVIRRKDGLAAYMFAVVIDDIAMGINEVVRGDDLADCTGQQLVVAAALATHCRDPGFRRRAAESRPRFVHVPLVYGDDDRRLAKRNQSLHVRNLQESGVPADRLLRWIAASLGMKPVSSLAEMIPQFSWGIVPKQGVVFGAQELEALTKLDGGEYSPVIRTRAVS